MDVDPLLVAAVDVACEAAELTDGLVHPLLGRTLVQLGYDRDFRLLRAAPPTRGPGPTPSRPAPTPGAASTATPPARSGCPPAPPLDLGSVGKAWTADLVAAAIEAELGEPALVSLGGDVRIAGPDGEPWEVAVSEQPGGPADELVGSSTAASPPRAPGSAAGATAA